MSFQRAIEAYAVADDEVSSDPFQRREYVVPVHWTAYHVAKRLVISVDIVDATTTTPGPKGFGNGWPAMMREFADLIDEQSMREHRAEVERGMLRRKMRPTPNEVGMAEEAIVWPATFLPPDSQEIDALMLWVLSTARDLNVARILARRRAEADTMISAIRRARGENEAAISDPERLKALARGVAATANVMIDEANAAVARARASAAQAKAQDADKAEQRALRAQQLAAEDVAFARRLALKRLKTIAGLEGLISRGLTERVRRSEVMPGKVFGQCTYDERRKLGAQIIADQLDARGVVVR